MYFKRLYITFLFTIGFSFVSAQNNIDSLKTVTLLFLSGDTAEFKLFEVNDWVVSGFQQKRNNGNWKLKNYPHSDLLYLYENHEEKQFFYNYQPSKGSFLSRPEMEQYVLGKKDALYHYSAKKQFYYATLFGFAVGLFDASYDYKEGYVGPFNGKSGLLSLSAPLISTFFVGDKKFKLMDKSIVNEGDVLEESYKHGYEIIRKSKNTKAVSRGSLLGVGVIIAIKLLK